MSDQHPMRVLMITPTDVGRAWNNREHHMARVFTEMGCEVSVLYKVLNRSKGRARFLLDTVWCSASSRHEKGVHYVRVDPFFNYFGGIRAASESASWSTRSRFGVRNRFVRCLSSLSCLRDMFFWPCFTVAAMIQLRGRYDAAIGFGPWGALIAWTLRSFGKASLFVYEDRDYEPGLLPHGVRRRYTGWLEETMLRRADWVISISKRLSRLRRAQSGRKINYIPTGVQWERFAAARQCRREGRVLLYVGNLVSWDGLDVAIRAMPQILSRDASVRLWIIGRGLAAYEQGLRSMVREANLGQAVEFFGSQPNERLPDLLGRAWIGLANSRPVEYRKYACPLKVMEYMAAGLPIIATDDTEAADMAGRFECGLSVPYNTAAFAEAVARLSQQPELYQRLRHNAICHSEAMDWHKLLPKELDIIKAGRNGSQVSIE